MARIRTIKPEFWRSPDVMELDNFQKLLFIGLWNLADDEGRGVFSPEAIAADLFLTEYSLSPHGVLTDVSNAFVMYSELDMVQLYSVGRRKYFQVQNWGKHQKINRPTPSKFPAPDQGVCIVQCEVIEDALDTHGGLTEDSVRTHDRNREQGTGNREQGTNTSSKKRNDYPADFEEWYTIYPRHVGKADALKAWKAATKKISRDDLNEATLRWAQAYEASGKDPNYIPHPATWLRRGGWDDELPTPELPPARRKATDLDDFMTQNPPF